MVFKIGGETAGSPEVLRLLAEEMSALRCGRILVHGGGAEVSSLMRRLGMRPEFRDGIRMTAPAEMDVVDQVLSGRVNGRLVRIFQSRGINAVGLSGSDGRLFVGREIAAGCRTGEIARVDGALVRLLLESGFFPIVSSTSMDGKGGGLNVNADEAAFALAGALHASRLVFLSDIPGVLKEDRVLAVLHPKAAAREIASGTIGGGMIPKVRSSLKALREGVDSVLIGEYRGRGDLDALLEGRAGTRIEEDGKPVDRDEAAGSSRNPKSDV